MRRRLNWQIPPIHTPIVQIEADPLDIGRSYPNTTGLVGDPKATVARLGHLVGRPPRDPGFAEDAARLVAAWRASMAPLVEKNTAPITVERLCAAVTRALPADGILVADTGYAGIWTGTLIELNGAGQTYLRAAGSLGWAFPASLGAKCAAGDRTVLCFTGDGGFYYHLAELESARGQVALVMHRGIGLERTHDLAALGIRTRDDLARWSPDALAAAIAQRHPRDRRNRFLDRRARVWTSGLGKP